MFAVFLDSTNVKFSDKSKQAVLAAEVKLSSVKLTLTQLRQPENNVSVMTQLKLNVIKNETETEIKT